MTKLKALASGLTLAAVLASTAPAAQNAAHITTCGVGLEERAAVDATRNRYNLRIAFTETDGSFIAGVRVKLSAVAGGTVHYAGESEGPYLLANLAPGSYRLEATYGGLAQERLLEVGSSQSQPYLYLRWPDGAAHVGGRG